MTSILQMRQKVLNRLTRPRGVQLSRAIVAANTRTVFELGVRVCRVRRQRIISQGVVSRVSHHDFEAVGWVRDMQLGDSSTEPFWRGLFHQEQTRC